MNWASASEFFAMGGYGFYVWGSYLVTVVLLAAELVALRVRHRHAWQQRTRADRGQP